MIDEKFWPQSEAFCDISDVEQWTDGRARCTGVAMCDEEGMPTKKFYQGQAAHFFYEFEILKEIDGVICGGLEFHDAAGTVIHGKNTFQCESSTLADVKPGDRLRYHFFIKMNVAVGEYRFTVGLAYSDAVSCKNYKEGPLHHEDFSGLIYELCRAIDAASFEVKFAEDGKLLHHGVADLPGGIYANRLEKCDYQPPAATVTAKGDDSRPTIFHITHWKAGSQWIYKILSACAPDLIVPPQLFEVQFKHWPIQEGKIYPTVYVTKDQFDGVRLPENSRRFVIIRDLRDTLISSYFSFKISHPITEPGLARLRAKLQSLSFDDGLIYMMSTVLNGSARIQLSWLEAGERLIHYEELLERDIEILEPILLDECRLPVSRERFREIVAANRFESLTKGRKRGEENIHAHERKGISGDWKNYFTDKVKSAFKARFGGALVATGYEKDLNW